jgi:SH3-like domain-containing protein
MKLRCRSWWLLPVAAVLLFSGCEHGRHRMREVAYVSVPEAFLRDQVATVYTKTGTVKNGERVEILARQRRFAQVRTASGAEGWVEQRYLVSQKVYDGFQQLAQQEQNDPTQAAAVTRNSTNMHLSPSREADHLYQLSQGMRVSLLKRTTAEKVLPGMPRSSSGNEEPAAPILEDWWLIRDAQGHVGWSLGRMLDVDVPLEVAQYAEGQRIVAVFVLDQVQDGSKKIAQYLMLSTEPKEGLPFDYNQIRVFTWNLKRHRYETAYRERSLKGVLPATVSHETFDKDGVLPVFVLRVKDDSGNIVERKYKLDTSIVRRVLASGEQPAGQAVRRKHQ